jgi:hypothetical protein
VLNCVGVVTDAPRHWGRGVTIWGGTESAISVRMSGFEFVLTVWILRESWLNAWWRVAVKGEL